jgi:hypothetical protein
VRRDRAGGAHHQAPALGSGTTCLAFTQTAASLGQEGSRAGASAPAHRAPRAGRVQRGRGAARSSRGYPRPVWHRAPELSAAAEPRPPGHGRRRLARRRAVGRAAVPWRSARKPGRRELQSSVAVG